MSEENDKEMARAALCRTASGCTSGNFLTCSYCDHYRSISLGDEEFKIEKGRVSVTKEAMNRALFLFKM